MALSFVLKSPLKKRKLRGYYSSGVIRDYQGISLKSLSESKQWFSVLENQYRALEHEDDEDAFDEALLDVMQSTMSYTRAYYEKVLPAEAFCSTNRRNCELRDVPECCGSDYRFRSR